VGIRWLENGAFRGAWHHAMSGAQVLEYETELRRLQEGEAVDSPRVLETTEQQATRQIQQLEQLREIQPSDLLAGRSSEVVEVSDPYNLPIPPPNSEVAAQPRADLEHRIEGEFQVDDPILAIQKSGNLHNAPTDLNQYHKNIVDIMTRDVTTVGPDSLSEEALNILDESNFHHLPVVDAEGRLIGLVSDRDLLGREGTLDQRMISRVLTASPDTGLQEAAKALVEQRFHCLVVVDEERRPQGMITGFDLLRYLVKHPAMQLWQSTGLSKPTPR
jgi:CBS domain-containing protein